MFVILICFFLALVKSDPYALTQANRDSLLSLHNQARANYGLPALRWDSALEASAKAWGDLCQWNHSKTNNGENLSRRSVSPIPAAPYATMRDYFIGWFDEEANFNCPLNTCKSGAVCGHFTQVIWKTTTLLGCSISLCPKMVANFPGTGYLVCQYSGPGNYANQHPLDPTVNTYSKCPVAAFARTKSPTEPTTPVAPTTPVSVPTAPLGTANPVPVTPVTPPPPPPPPTPVAPSSNPCLCSATINYPCGKITSGSGTTWYCKIDSSSTSYWITNYGTGTCVGPFDPSVSYPQCLGGKSETRNCVPDEIPQKYFGGTTYWCRWEKASNNVAKVTNIGLNGCTGAALTSDTIADKFDALPLPAKIGIGVGCGLFVIIVIVIIVVVVKKKNNGSDEQGLETY